MEEVLTFQDAAQWEAWLASHHHEPGGAWIKIGKKGSTKKLIGIADAGDVALCYGWIDSIRKSYDADCFVQKYSPRRPKGSWSKVNVDRAEALIAAGRMREPGFAEIEAAKADGRWDTAYVSQKESTVPPEVAAALAANGQAGQAFAKLGKTEQYLLILPWLKARTPKTRATQLTKLLETLTR
ncbi:YdeI/OmpD-associated family protein [Catelliglobosispora koreensis]|uniref:YdeI/OmpD-associated family protein n=1 Tax=Catelliglobosispora koreensis TaxID=129052 RepID=UPI00037F595C|nr:YdeI/OmpD-associated family protein [Catelliglobosispora koreensis]